MPTRFLHDCRRTAARNLIRASVAERVAMLLTSHKSRAIFDRYNIINEQELLDAGDQLVAYLAQQAQATPRGGRPHPARTAAPRTAPPHRVRRTSGPPAPARRRRPRGRGSPDTARLCAATRAQATQRGGPTPPTVRELCGRGRGVWREPDGARIGLRGVLHLFLSDRPRRGRPRGHRHARRARAVVNRGKRWRAPSQPGNDR